MPRKKLKKRSGSVRAKKGVLRRAASGGVQKTAKFFRKASAVDLSRKKRVHVVLKNLLLFGILFVLCVVIASASANQLVDQLFWILAILTAFVAVAFLIILLIFVFMNRAKK